jgi:hypothetical protein
MKSAAELFGFYLCIGGLITLFILGGKSFTEGTKRYQKALGVAFMVVLWPVVLCVRGPDDRT